MTDEFRKLIKFYKMLDQQQKWAIRESLQTIGRNDIANDLRHYDAYENERPGLVEAYEAAGAKFVPRDEMEEFVVAD